MEAIPEDGSEPHNRDQVKNEGEDGQQGGRSSPPPNCVICMDTCQNKSFTDSCLHEFCFNCLLTWSRVKAECPLCKQPFRSIIHNVQSNQQYDEYLVAQQPPEDLDRIDIDNINIDINPRHRFRYRTTLTFPRRESLMAIQQLLLDSYHALHIPRALLPGQSLLRRRVSSGFRKTVYRHNLWARPLPDYMGRFRDCSPLYFRYNEAQSHRLVPWINRELNYLLNYNYGHITYVMNKILELLTRLHVASEQFRDELRCYFGCQTDHFTHELHCFASTPFDMAGYDHNVQYTTREHALTERDTRAVCQLDSDSSADSDVVLLDAPVDLSLPGPSRLREEDDDVMLVGYIRPPRDRTPEVVDLLGSDADSDVVLQDEVPADNNLVRLTLRQWRGPEATSSVVVPDTEVPEITIPSPEALARLEPPSPEAATTDYTPSRSSSSDTEGSVKVKKRKYKRSRSKRKSSTTDPPRKKLKKKARSPKEVKSSHGEAGPSGVAPRRLRSVVIRPVASPRSGSPPLASPSLASPRLSSPRLSSPRLSSPRLSSPHLSSSHLSSSHLSSPHLSSPHLSSPHLSSPHLSSPHLSSSHLSSPSVASSHRRRAIIYSDSDSESAPRRNQNSCSDTEDDEPLVLKYNYDGTYRYK